MKKFALGFFLGLLLMFGIGATTDDALRTISVTLTRIARSLEIMAGQPRK